MRFINNLRIRSKLLVLIAVLLLPLLFFSLSSLVREMDDKRTLQEVLGKVRESEVLSALLHEIQKERALSISYMISNTTTYQSQLEVQRQNTDLAITRASKYAQEQSSLIDNQLQSLSELPAVRQQIDRQVTDSLRFESFYGSARDRLLEYILNNARNINDDKIRSQLTSNGYLLEAKVYLGLLRSLVSRILITHTLSTKDYGDFQSHKSIYDNYLRRFTKTASPHMIAAYQQQVSTGALHDVVPFLASIGQNPGTDLSGQRPEAWFAQFSGAIDQLREMERTGNTETIGVMTEKIAQKSRLLAVYTGVVLLILALAFLISYYIITNVSGSLQMLKVASDRVSRGYTDVTIQVHSTDEAGELANSFRKLINKNIQLAKVAEAIGEGRYEVAIEAHHEGDVLANALLRMKHKLLAFSVENANRQWHLSGLSELNNQMSGTQQMQPLNQRIIQFLTGYTQASVGVLYLLDDYEKLNFASGFALNASVDQLPSYSLGEGQVGQAAVDRKVVVLHEVPAQHLRVKTATVEMAPLSVVIVPCYLEKVLVGVLEFASQREFSAREIHWLQAAAEKVAVVIHSLQVHLRTQELLHETQNQAEELETQQEELRQVNVELKAQKEQLQASEEELKVNQEELEEKNSELQEKTRQLEAQYDAIQAKNREVELAREAVELKIRQVETISRYKSDFLANMSHELRTPLNSILILSRLMADNTGHNLTTKQQEHAEIIYNSGSDLLKLINDILDLSKIESGQVSLEMKAINPRDIQMHGLFDHLARQKKIQFVSEFADDLPPTLSTDQFRLEQILKNLLSNAFKFTPVEGKVTYRVYPLRQPITFTRPSLRDSREIVAFSVQDTGIGIPENKQQLVFEAFQQADTSTTRKFGGTGLGLSISRELASLLGGEIRVESRENQGSSFTLYLPKNYVPDETGTAKPVAEKLPDAAGKGQASYPAPVSIQEVLEAPATGKNARKVLIIEDDKGFSQIVADFATHKEFQVSQAFTGQEGLDLLYRQIPDAVLLDINLPDMSGWNILQRINDDPKLRHIKVHVMSAYDKETLGRPLEEEEYISKPVTLEMLDKAFSKIRQSGSTIQTVLVVEDNAGENRAITELLLAHGITSVSAFSGKEAQAQLHQTRVDCIILDLNLPDTGGYELMETIRVSGRNLPIIIYSGKDLTEEEEFRLKKYANTIIIKNQFSYIRLLDEVQLFLHKINDKLPGEQAFTMKLHIPEEVLKDKKVLVVDDDVRNVYSLYNLLEQYQMKIVVANDGKEALEKVTTEKDLDMILMDMMMPEMDGAAAIRQIRKNPALARLPIIALTAKAMKGDKERCIEAGASDYISKPIDVSKLLALMRVWLYKGI